MAVHYDVVVNFVNDFSTRFTANISYNKTVFTESEKCSTSSYMASRTKEKF